MIEEEILAPRTDISRVGFLQCKNASLHHRVEYLTIELSDTISRIILSLDPKTQKIDVFFACGHILGMYVYHYIWTVVFFCATLSNALGGSILELQL